MTIKYYTKQVYGNTLMYLIDSKQARAILRLIGQKTISKFQIEQFEILGVTFERTFEPENNN